MSVDKSNKYVTGLSLPVSNEGVRKTILVVQMI
jgi:hypothetical protein